MQHTINHLIAGSTAGLCEVLIMYPLDVVKTRHQLATAKYVMPSVMDTLRGTIRNEGFRALYRGILPPILAEAPKRALKFTANEQYKSMLGGSGPLLWYTAATCGALAGMTEAVVVTPFETVKVRLQSAENRALYSNSVDCLSKIAKTEGTLSLYNGFGATLWRNGAWNSVYFSVINQIKSLLPSPNSKSTEVLRNFVAGATAGTMATTANNPFDLVKSRIQNRVAGQPVIYKYTLPSIAKVAQEEGLLALWKGWVPKVMRLGPGGGIMLVTFEFVSGLLN